LGRGLGGHYILCKIGATLTERGVVASKWGWGREGRRVKSLFFGAGKVAHGREPGGGGGGEAKSRKSHLGDPMGKVWAWGAGWRLGVGLEKSRQDSGGGGGSEKTKRSVGATSILVDCAETTKDKKRRQCEGKQWWLQKRQTNCRGKGKKEGGEAKKWGEDPKNPEKNPVHVTLKEEGHKERPAILKRLSNETKP